MNYDTYLFQIDTINNMIDDLLKSNLKISSQNKYIVENEMLINSLKDQLSTIRDNYSKFNSNDDNYNFDRYEFIEKLNFYSDDDYLNKDTFNDILFNLNDFIDIVIERIKNIIYNPAFNRVQTIINDSINNLYTSLLYLKIEIQYNKTIYIEQDYNQDNLNKFTNYVFERVDESKTIKEDLKQLKKNNKLNEIDTKLVDEFIDVLYFMLKKITEFCDKLKSVNLNEINSEFNYKKYEKDIMKLFDNIRDNDIPLEELNTKIVDLYNKNHKYNELVYIKENINESEKEKDEIEYKKYCTYLNNSFWEARQQASKEDIKYPSANYERAVKEYQNNYLISKYNVSLEDVEYYIEQYKEKYSTYIYMDDIYSKALSLIREESTSSIEEICDETNGISMLDRYALNLLKSDLFDVIKEISFVKKEEHLDGFIDVSRYRMSIRISKLIDKKEMIENQIQTINYRANRLESYS